jgi:hypothetical protein
MLRSTAFHCWCLTLLLVVLAAGTVRAKPSDYFSIHIVDDQTGRGVPLVQLQTTNKVRYYTDSNGYVAFDEPGLMNQDIYFAIASWGYQGPDFAFGNKGAVLRTVPGNVSEIKIHRLNIAERMYRLTGEGIYRDTVLLGRKPPVAEGLLNGKIMGSDTVETAVYRGQMYWFWGDADCPFFPLGNFSTTGATSPLSEHLDLSQGIDYTYFVNPATGFARGMIAVKAGGSLPIWIDGLMVVPDASGQSRMLANYVRTQSLAPVERGIAVFDDATKKFEELRTYPVNAPLGPGAHPMRAVCDGRDYYYFPHPYAIRRVLADFEHATDIATYEGFTCLKPGAGFSREKPDLNRDAAGKLLWTWQTGARPIGPSEFHDWIKSGVVTAGESLYQMSDDDTGKPINAVEGSMAWNPFLKKWTMLFGELGGKSNLGEIWFAEANAPEGPWRAAKKIATHAMKNENYDFYNPMQHPELMQDGGRIIYFEGTFVTTFSGNPFPVPRYDYNQILYRLDVSDPRLSLPPPPPKLSHTDPSKIGP